MHGLTIHGSISIANDQVAGASIPISDEPTLSSRLPFLITGVLKVEESYPQFFKAPPMMPKSGIFKDFATIELNKC